MSTTFPPAARSARSRRPSTAPVQIGLVGGAEQRFDFQIQGVIDRGSVRVVDGKIFGNGLIESPSCPRTAAYDRLAGMIAPGRKNTAGSVIGMYDLVGFAVIISIPL